ncbi:carbohydrate kinase family protein [Microbacterium rhizosphaerae]|uniref:Carbohydrate kinase family protein n=1 Tax=Microbacterium rhizosphaerae TaxID=1678237 RepID=A0ABZ0SPA2_9MICO|nr:carbohydrate kinase family protein [Microbacterium rhizosphaerae]WPR89658.1 carbohydrate kinase family protein [Microbacterium rhizosphaerae]
MTIPHSPVGSFVFAGDTYCDLVFSGAELPGVGEESWASGFRIAPGGVATRAVASARTGGSAVLFSRLGDDPLGAYTHRVLQDEPRLDTSSVVVVRGAQSPVSVAVSGAHDRSFITYEERLPDLPVPSAQTRYAAVQVSLSEAGVPTWVADQRAAGARVYGGVGWDGTGKWDLDLSALLTDVDVFIPNELEAARYSRLHDPRAAVKWLANFVPLAIVTMGKRGVVAVDSANDVFVELPAAVVESRDPTGAGDVFTGALVTAASWNIDLRTQLLIASLAASISVTRLGGATSAPTWTEIVEFAHRIGADELSSIDPVLI